MYTKKPVLATSAGVYYSDMIDSFITHTGLTQEAIVNYLWGMTPGLVASLGVVLAGTVFYSVTARGLEAALKRTPMQRSLIRITVRSLYRGIIIAITFIFILSQLGINVTAALAGVGVVGIAVGFAAQATIANILSGFGIFIDHLFRAGDWVTIDGNYGEVVSITLRTTKIRTLDNTFVSIPNSVVTSSAVTNFTEQGMVRVTATVSIAYRESIDKARAVLVAAAQQIDGIRMEPTPEVVVDELADSGVVLKVRVWVDNPRFEERFRFILAEACKKALDEAGINIPFPQRDVHMIGK